MGTVEAASPSEALPTVSVLALSYNHERFVDESLDAIGKQTFRDFELIIVDDCSTDDTARRVEHWLERTGFPATFVRNETNLGVSASRNLGLSLAGAVPVHGCDRRRIQTVTPRTSGGVPVE